MIHYHGTPIACSDDQAARILKGRHAFVSYGSRNSVYQLPIIEEVCQSYALDNGAFSLFKSGNPVDWDGYYKFLDEVYGPSTDFAIIPDEIGGSEKDQDRLIAEWPFENSKIEGVPVWHSNESINRLSMLAERFQRICIGSGPGLNPNSAEWWMRINQAFDVLTDEDGRPCNKIHLLRGLNNNIFTKLPVTSADSTMVGRSMRESSTCQWTGSFKPITHYAKAMVLIDRIENFNAPKRWTREPIQTEFNLWEFA